MKLRGTKYEKKTKIVIRIDWLSTPNHELLLGINWKGAYIFFPKISLEAAEQQQAFWTIGTKVPRRDSFVGRECSLTTPLFEESAGIWVGRMYACLTASHHLIVFTWPASNHLTNVTFPERRNSSQSLRDFYISSNFLRHTGIKTNRIKDSRYWSYQICVWKWACFCC